MSATVDLSGAWEREVLAGALAEVDPRRHLGVLRALVQAACEADRSLVALFQALAAAEPIALADLAVGPRAPAGPRLVEAALAVVESLEAQVAVGALYRRLVVLAGPDAGAVLAVAARRHPAAGWLVTLSETARETCPGRTHLIAAAEHPGFAQACWAHAAAGHLDGLVAAAEATGRPEPAAALLAHGAVERAQHVAAHLLQHAPEAPVAAYLAGVQGPDLESFWRGVVPLLHGAEARARLAALRAD